MKINKIFKTISLAIFTMGAVQYPQNNIAQQKLLNDTISIVTPMGTNDNFILSKAPSPLINICGKTKSAIFVIDLNKNFLYQYDKSGNAQSAYLIASGKKNTPTDTGLRIVTHIESYPYKNAPKTTRRYRKPNDYGPNIICLNKVDSITGKTTPTGEFIHGNNNIKSLGKYASLGCIRMDNSVIKKLSKIVKKGDLILIKK